MARWAFLLLTAFLLQACSGLSGKVPPPQHSRAELLNTKDLDPQMMEQVRNIDILELDEEMRAYVDRHVPEDAPGRTRARHVLEAIFGRGPVDLQYDNLKTYTAIEAWHAGEGNCMAFTSLYIALAREAGLNARFQVVEVPPSWAASGNLFISNLHINALVDYAWGDDQVVDFDIENFSDQLPRRRISDRAATARYHSNMGVHWMLHDDLERARAHLLQSIRIESTNPSFWTNLGALYLKLADTDYATSAFLVALELDRSDLVAISNLARIYEQQGDVERARAFSERVAYFRQRNPYYLYHQAGAHYEAGEYVQARSELQRALLIQSDHRFFRLLGLAELKLGNAEAAERNLELARDHAQTAAERNLYQRKLSILEGSTQ